LYSTKAIEVVLQDLKSPLVQTAIRNFGDVQQNYAAGRHDLGMDSATKKGRFDKREKYDYSKC
jgi:hypothetical protein